MFLNENKNNIDQYNFLMCRCAPLLEVLLRVLEAYLQASKMHLIAHAQVRYKQWTKNAMEAMFVVCSI